MASHEQLGMQQTSVNGTNIHVTRPTNQWNKNAEEYATRTGERVSDGIRRAVYINKIVTTRHAATFDVESIPFNHC